MARLSYSAKKSLPSSDFAVKGGKGATVPGKGSYPIPDASHARNALARVSQFGSSAEKAEVRAKVHAKFPSIGNNPTDAHKSTMKHAWGNNK
jgi:hypothetical protein